MADGNDGIDALIRRLDLHRTCPVDVSPLYDLYKVQLLDDISDAVLGLAYTYHGHGLIGINAILDRPNQRMVLAHECAHLVTGDPNSLYLCRLNAWLYHRYELLAQRAAARILIPRRYLSELATSGLTVPQMAWELRVPEVLVEMRLKRN